MSSGIANPRIARMLQDSIRHSTASIISDATIDSADEYVNVKLHREDAKWFLIWTIRNWFHEQGIDIEAKKAKELAEKADKHKSTKVPWYQGGYDGFRVDKMIIHNAKAAHEGFRKNPYGLGARWYWFLVFCQLTFMFGNIMGGLVDAWENVGNDDKRYHWIPVLRGGISALPAVWITTLFIFPPLIARAKEQYYTQGHCISDSDDF